MLPDCVIIQVAMPFASCLFILDKTFSLSGQDGRLKKLLGAERSRKKIYFNPTDIQISFFFLILHNPKMNRPPCTRSLPSSWTCSLSGRIWFICLLTVRFTIRVGPINEILPRGYSIEYRLFTTEIMQTRWQQPQCLMDGVALSIGSFQVYSRLVWNSISIKDNSHTVLLLGWANDVGQLLLLLLHRPCRDGNDALAGPVVNLPHFLMDCSAK